ncbi:MAG: DUF58 domain-containing protein [Treponema sp.]|jgi:hypothetical protein|nr:DUF58 domain-containing protein [Treponema sp.]
MGKPRFRPVFTPAGAAILVVAIVVLIRSLYARNSYEILLSFAALILLLALGVIGRWKAKKLAGLEPGWKVPFPMTANAGEESLITGLGTPLPLFFRLHFIVRGKFSPAGGDVSADSDTARAEAENTTTVKSANACFMSAETSVSRGEKTARIEMDFPMSGIFRGSGFCRLRDIFGLFSFSCGVEQKRTVKVRSAPCFGRKLHINAQSGAEDRRNKNSTNEERFYMREYSPGDRLRDINWKSSEKIDALITRISPDNQEKVSRIEVYFRNFGPAKPSIEALWLLDRAKARLSHFLRSLLEENSSFIFSVRAARGNWEIQDSEDLENFLEELAGLSFSAAQNEGIVPAGAGDMYVFSTACDAGLPGFLLACHPRPVSLFIVQPETFYKDKVIKRVGPDHETFCKRDFPAKGCIPLLRWLSKTKIEPLNVNAGRVERIYAETRL